MPRNFKKKKLNKLKMKPNIILNKMKASIKVANSETASILLSKISDLVLYQSTTTDQKFKIDCISYKECSENLFNWMINLLEENMADLYKACDWGWNVDSKKCEMSEENVRFLIAYNEFDCKPVAFSHFRFDMDNNTSVVYCYELQLMKSARKQGLAKHIMQVLEALCMSYNLKKVVLTVFNHNQNAVQFFSSQGYTVDETSPEKYSVQTFYTILSKINKFFLLPKKNNYVIQ